jgi:glycosyltransferase involved in cell wall biosynthesis
MAEPAMADPDLSVCIPTYNRCDYLARTLESLAPLRARLRTEIVVSDDGSSDGTRALLESRAAADPAIRVLKQAKRLGGFANTVAAMRAARGRYAAYLADDDRLIADEVARLVGWLDANPEWSAVFTPVDTYDLATETSHGAGLHTKEVCDFATAQRFELVEYIAMGLTPEAAIYRAGCLRMVDQDPKIFSTLLFLNAALSLGKVRFAPTPHYRAILAHWPGERREQLFHGMMADVLGWETFRAGLESILAAQPDGFSQPQRMARARARIDATLAQRQGTALDFLGSQGRWPEFVSAYRILALRGALPRAFGDTDLLNASFRAIAAVALAQAAELGSRRVVVVGLGDLGVLLEAALRERGAELTVAADAAAGQAAAAGGALVLAADRGLVDQCVAAGMAPHAVLDFARLYGAYDLMGLPRAPAAPAA